MVESNMGAVVIIGVVDTGITPGHAPFDAQMKWKNTRYIIEAGFISTQSKYIS